MFALAAAAALAEPFLAPVAFGFGLVADAVPPRVDLAGLGLLLLGLFDLRGVELLALFVDVDVFVFVPPVLLAAAALLA